MRPTTSSDVALHGACDVLGACRSRLAAARESRSRRATCSSISASSSSESLRPSWLKSLMPLSAKGLCEAETTTPASAPRLTHQARPGPGVGITPAICTRPPPLVMPATSAASSMGPREPRVAADHEQRGSGRGAEPAPWRPRGRPARRAPASAVRRRRRGCRQCQRAAHGEASARGCGMLPMLRPVHAARQTPRRSPAMRRARSCKRDGLASARRPRPANRMRSCVSAWRTAGACGPS